jgi:hypothetical protein
VSNSDIDAETEQSDLPQAVRTAQLIVIVEAFALVGGAVAVVVETFVSTAHRLWIPLALAGLMVLLALILVGCVRGLGQDRLSARTPIIMTQLLSLPVGYSLGFQAGRPLFGVPILVVAIAVLGLLFSPSARARL